MRNDVQNSLLAIAASAFEERNLPEVIDWDALIVPAALHGLLPLANEFYRCSASTSHPEFEVQLHHQTIIHTARSVMLRHQLKRVLGMLSIKGIPAVVLKGPALAETIYKNTTLRPFNDLDLLCHEENWTRIHFALMSLGFEPIRDVPSPPPKVWHRKSFGHNAYQDLKTGATIEIHFDLWQSGLRPRLGETFWNRAVDCRVAGVDSKILSIEDQILHLCVHLQSHSYSRLIWFTDLALLLRCNHNTLDWDYILKVARAEAITVSVYYCLYYLDALLGVKAPAEILGATKPGALMGWLHDILWPPDILLQLRVMDRVGFSFQEVPKANEFILNLILTGRVPEKLYYLVRLLVPSEIWLARYYDTEDHAILRRRRIVHAPKLFMMGLRGLYRAGTECISGHFLQSVKT